MPRSGDSDLSGPWHVSVAHRICSETEQMSAVEMMPSPVLTGNVVPGSQGRSERSERAERSERSEQCSEHS